MTRVAAVVLVFATAALAETGNPSITLVDGTTLPIERLIESNPAQTRVQLLDQPWTVPTQTIVALRFGLVSATPARLYNLYLRNGDVVHGTVTGDGDSFRVEGKSISGLKVSLETVRAVRFGRLLHGLQAKYDEVFSGELAKGRDAVIIQRDTRPFPIAARVLGVSSEHLTVQIGDTRRDLPLHKVYGFVRSREAAKESTDKRIQVRVTMRDYSKITLPLLTIADEIRAGGAIIQRADVRTIEYTGAHIAHIADFDPIQVKEVGLFGDAPKWRRDAMVLGGPLRLDDEVYERGIGVHAYSRLEFVLGKRWKHLFLRAGIDDAAGREGAATFRVIGDGKLLKEIKCSVADLRSSVISLDVSDVDRLVLEVDPGESPTSDFCNWADARVFNADPVRPPDTNEEKK